MVANPIPVDEERGKRAVASLVPFVRAGWIHGNPEDLEEIAHAVLTYADSSLSYTEIDRAVTEQIREAKQRAAHRVQVRQAALERGRKPDTPGTDAGLSGQ